MTIDRWNPLVCYGPDGTPFAGMKITKLGSYVDYNDHVRILDSTVPMDKVGQLIVEAEQRGRSESNELRWMNGVTRDDSYQQGQQDERARIRAAVVKAAGCLCRADQISVRATSVLHSCHANLAHLIPTLLVIDAGGES